MKKFHLLTPLGFLVLVCLSSCIPVEKMVYIQSKEGDPVTEFSHKKEEYRLQINDILDVKISSLNPEVNALFNASTVGTMQAATATAQTGGDLFYITGYSIDQNGEIDIPFVGSVDVLGLTLSQAHDAIDAKVDQLFTNFHLRVKLGGVRFSVIGEFNRPGKHVVMQNQVTIFEAIALGGDLNATANRGELQLIRQGPFGTKIHTVNLLDESIVGTEYYFIQPNDVLYAQPLPQKSWGFGVTGAQTLSTIVGGLSTSAALVLSIISLRNN
ncbi:MAG: polysaccharide biosynthesis/export family protein [Flavobacteriaceae bacterium]